MRIGLAWYEERDYPAILAMIEDAHCLPATFASQREKAGKGERELARQGHTVVRVIINPNEFAVRCRSRSLSVDVNARKLFASSIAAWKQ